MSTPFLAGVRSANAALREDRQAKQQRLNNQIAGYEQDANGEFQPNALGQAANDTKQAALEQKLMMLEETNAMLTSNFNTQSMTDATTELGLGRPEEAWKIVDRNPMLKAKLAESFDAANIMPVDFTNDTQLFADKGITITPEMTNDPQTLAALNSSFFKVIGKDGKSRIANTQQLMQATNYANYLGVEEHEGMVSRFNRANEILSGHVMTPQDRQIQAQKKQLEAQQVATAVAAGSIKQNVINDILGDNSLSDIGKLTKLRALSGDAKDDKARSDAELAKLKVEVAREGAGKMDGAAEFLDNIHDATKIPFNDSSLKKAKALQGKTTNNKALTNTSGRLTMAKQFTKLANKFASMKDLKRDGATKVLTAFGIHMGSGSTQHKNELVANLGMNTEMQAMVAEYVKFMSGAAVTNEEYQRYQKIVMAGDWSTKESANIALNSFANYLRDSARNTLGDLVNIPYDHLNARHAVDVWEAANPRLDIEDVQDVQATANGFDPSKFAGEVINNES